MCSKIAVYMMNETAPVTVTPDENPYRYILLVLCCIIHNLTFIRAYTIWL